MDEARSGLMNSVPDDWVGEHVKVQYKTSSYDEGSPWGVSVINGRLVEKSDLGILIEVRSFGEDSKMLVAYDAILTLVC